MFPFVDSCALNPCNASNSVSCSNRFNPNFRNCTCRSGFVGAGCEIDLNDCVSSPCLNGGRCVDGPGSYTCECASGHGGVNCNTEIDECASNPCQFGLSCADRLDGYVCNSGGGGPRTPPAIVSVTPSVCFREGGPTVTMITRGFSASSIALSVRRFGVFNTSSNSAAAADEYIPVSLLSVAPTFGAAASERSYTIRFDCPAWPAPASGYRFVNVTAQPNDGTTTPIVIHRTDLLFYRKCLWLELSRVVLCSR